MCGSQRPHINAYETLKLCQATPHEGCHLFITHQVKWFWGVILHLDAMIKYQMYKDNGVCFMLKKIVHKNNIGTYRLTECNL